MSDCALSALRLPVLGDGIGQYAQYHHEDSPRPAAQHRVLSHGHVRHHRRSGQGAQRIRRGGLVAETPSSRHASALQFARSGSAGMRDDLSERQPSHHHADQEQAVRPILQEIPVHLTGQLRHLLRHGATRNRVYGGPRILLRTLHRHGRSHRRRHYRHPSDAALRVSSQS